MYHFIKSSSTKLKLVYDIGSRKVREINYFNSLPFRQIIASNRFNALASKRERNFWGYQNKIREAEFENIFVVWSRKLSHIYKSWRLKLWWVSAQWSLLKPDDQSSNPVFGKFSVIQQKGTQTSSITSIGAQLRHLNVLKSKYVWWASGRIKNYADNSRKEYNDEL